jgi:hypothetical protein
MARQLQLSLQYFDKAKSENIQPLEDRREQSSVPPHYPIHLHQSDDIGFLTSSVSSAPRSTCRAGRFPYNRFDQFPVTNIHTENIQIT